MRRPGSEKVTERFAEAQSPGGLIRPARKSKARRDAPFSLRLSSDEKTQLKAAAGHMALGAYIKARLFDGLPAVPRQCSPSIADKQMMAQLLAVLGSTRLSSNMNQIARASNNGALQVDDELITELSAACEDIRTMRTALLVALGKRKAENSTAP